MFPGLNLTRLRTAEWPILIGVIRRTTSKRAREFLYNYEYRVLLSRDMLPQVMQTSTPQKLLGKLRTFREEWYHNEKRSVSFLLIEFDGRQAVLVVRFQSIDWIVSGCFT